METSWISKIYLNKRNEKTAPDLWAKISFCTESFAHRTLLYMQLVGRFCSGFCFLSLWIPWDVCMEILGWALPALQISEAGWLGNLEDKQRLT